jgi:hypothetical protein
MIIMRVHASLVLLALPALGWLAGCAGHSVHQVAATNWQPTVSAPQFAPDTGPLVRVDAAHGNWHKIDARFVPSPRYCVQMAIGWPAQRSAKLRCSPRSP